MSLKVCPGCKKRDVLGVINSREHIDGCYRRYKCSGCGHRFSSVETQMDMLPYKQLRMARSTLAAARGAIDHILEALK